MELFILFSKSWPNWPLSFLNDFHMRSFVPLPEWCKHCCVGMIEVTLNLGSRHGNSVFRTFNIKRFVLSDMRHKFREVQKAKKLYAKNWQFAIWCFVAIGFWDGFTLKHFPIPCLLWVRKLGSSDNPLLGGKLITRNSDVAHSFGSIRSAL